MFYARTTSLRTTTLKAIAVALTALLALQVLTSELIIGRSFRELEERSVQGSMQQTLKTLQNEIDALYGNVKDYAVWDPTYAFVEQRDLEYINTHVSVEALRTIRASYIAFINRSGDIVYARRQSLIDGQVLPVPAALTSFDGANAHSFRLLHRTMGSAG